MSNLACITICIIVSFVTTAIFMSAYKEAFKAEYESDKSFIYSIIRDHRSLLTSHSDSLDILRARITDSENKIKEMETTDNGK